MDTVFNAMHYQTIAEAIIATEAKRLSGRSFIQAIKLFRAITNTSLADAKSYCDAAVVDLHIGEYQSETCATCHGSGRVDKWVRGF